MALQELSISVGRLEPRFGTTADHFGKRNKQSIINAGPIALKRLVVVVVVVVVAESLGIYHAFSPFVISE